ncbi:hypothetical protein NUSPORA_02574 [Nucleospora cyclopteri]
MGLLEIEGFLGLLKLRRAETINAYSECIYTNKTPKQKKVLDEIFEITPYPGKQTRNNVSILLNLSNRKVQVYFQNLRMHMKKVPGNQPRLSEKGFEIDVEKIYQIFQSVYKVTDT